MTLLVPAETVTCIYRVVILLFISYLAVNSMHIDKNKMHILYSEKKSYFSLVTDTTYILTVAKQGFLGNLGTGTFFKRF